jgi:hypothetical protein
MSWHALKIKIEQLFQENNPPQFWLRDDDAFKDNPKIRSMIEIVTEFEIPLSVSIVPAKLEPTLISLLKGNPLITILQHGYRHINHGKGSGLSGEFQNHRALEIMVEELKNGRKILKESFGDQFYPVFVPPWNQISDAVISKLTDLGFCGVSRFGEETRNYNCSIINCQLDLLKWKPEPHFIGEEKSLNILLEALENNNSPSIGILTHHLDHKPELIEFLRTLFFFTRENNIPWRSVKSIFESKNGNSTSSKI